MSKRKSEVQGGTTPFNGDGSDTVQEMDPNRRATAAQMASRKIRQARGYRRPAVPGNASPAFAGGGQQSLPSPFSSVDPNIVTSQNTQSFSFNQTAMNNPSGSQPSIFSPSMNQTQNTTATSQNSSFNVAQPQTFNFSTPSTGFSFSTPSINNPFSTTNGPLPANTLGNGGFSGSIFNIPPSAPPAISSQLPPFSSTNIFAQASTTNSQLPQAPQGSKTLFSGLINNNTIGTQQGNGVVPQSSIMNGNIEDNDAMMMSASPDNSPMKQGAEYLSAGSISPTRDTSKQQTQPSELSRTTTPPFVTNSTLQQQTGPGDVIEKRATPSATSTSELPSEASGVSKAMTTPPTTSSTSFGNDPPQQPISTVKSGFNPFSATQSPTINNTSPTKDISQATETSLTAPTTFGKVSTPSTVTNEQAGVPGPVVRFGGPQRTTAPSTGMMPSFTEAQRKEYETLYQYLSLETSFKKQVASLPPGGDIDALTEDYWRRRAEIFWGGSSTRSLAGKKRKEMDEDTHEAREDPAKRSRVNGPEKPIPHPVNHASAGPSTTGNTGGKRKAEDALSKDTAADVNTAKKIRSQEPVSYPSLPSASASVSKEQSQTSALFKDILAKATTTTQAPFEDISAKATTTTQAPFEDISAKATTTTQVPFEDISAKATNTTPAPFKDILAKATTTTPANPFPFKPPTETSSGASALKLPQFAPSTMNFLAQFSKSAQEAEEKEKQKRKAEDFDSEDEDEKEWERRDAEAQLAKKAKLEEQAKSAVAKYIPGKGFTFVPLEAQQSIEGNKDDVSQTSTSGLSGVASGGLGSSNSVVGTSRPEPPSSSGFTSAVFASATSFVARSSSDQTKATTVTTKLFSSAAGTNSTSVFGAATTSATSSGVLGSSNMFSSTSNIAAPKPASVKSQLFFPEKGSMNTAQPTTSVGFGSNGGSSGSVFGSVSATQPGLTRPHQTISGSFALPFGTTTPSPSPPPSRSNSVLDQGPSFGQHDRLQPSNIFAHLSDVDSGAENASKGGDADDEDTETGDEVASGEGQQNENEPVPDEEVVHADEVDEPSLDGDAASDEKPVEETVSSPKEKENGTSGEDTPKPASSGLSLFDRISRADGDTRPLPTFNGDSTSTPKSSEPSEPPNNNAIFGQLSSTPMKGNNPFNFNTSPSGDNTWKPNTPIKFGTNSAAPSFSFTAPTPSRAGQDEGKKTTASPFLSNFSSGQPAKPLFGSPSANTTTGKAAEVGFGFGGPPRPVATSLLAPSAGASNNTSRATSPGLTSDTGVESANESNEGAEEKQAQIDLAGPGPGEEEEEILFQVRAKAMMWESTGTGEEKKWQSKGVGPLRVLKHRETGQVRILMKQDPRGLIVLNTALMKGIKYELKDEKTLSMATASEDGSLSSWIVRVGKSEDAKRLSSLLEEEKNSQTD